MEEARTNRRLAAILAADVVGYSRLMAADEAGTLSALKQHRDVVFNPAVSRYGGRVVKLIGDGTLVEFASVVDAVNCALAVQRAGDSVITLRIGVNLGDVIIDGDDIYGDGVNVAARLEPLADPGGICIASIVNESVGNRVEASFEDAGEVQVKNIDRPIRVWKWSPENGQRAGNKPAPAQAASPPDQPSIAVLPFANMSGDAEQEYFSDGITEDIITDLSKVAGLLVIARNSSFAYKGRHVDIRKVASELRVRSVLEGSIRRAGNRVRITAQLIDAETGGHLWAERYDRDLTDIFELQDEVTREIVGALKIALSPGERSRLAGDDDTTDIEAHDLFMRGLALSRTPTLTLDVFTRASALYKQAIERDPSYGRAYAGLAGVLINDWQNRWTDNPEGSLVEAARLNELAREKTPNDPYSHAQAGLIAMLRKDFERASEEVDIAISLNPNLPMAHAIRAGLLVGKGNPLGAIPHLERAIRLDPAFTHLYLHHLAAANLLAGKYETAAALFKERILLAPATDISRAYLASAFGHLGEVEEARRLWKELMAINPKYSFEEHMQRQPYAENDIARIRKGLAKAGLPD
jgi:adenylate cyclase